jgi:hypothetical protein
LKSSSSSSSSSLIFLQAQCKRKSSNPLLTNDYTPIKKRIPDEFGTSRSLNWIIILGFIYIYLHK